MNVDNTIKAMCVAFALFVIWLHYHYSIGVV